MRLSLWITFFTRNWPRMKPLEDTHCLVCCIFISFVVVLLLFSSSLLSLHLFCHCISDRFLVHLPSNLSSSSFSSIHSIPSVKEIHIFCSVSFFSHFCRYYSTLISNPSLILLHLQLQSCPFDWEMPREKTCKVTTQSGWKWWWRCKNEITV